MAELFVRARQDVMRGHDAIGELAGGASDAEIPDVRAGGDSMGYTLLTLLITFIAYWRATSFERTLSNIHPSRRRHG